MAKEEVAGSIVSPANLWGKQLPKTLHKEATKKEEKKEKETRMLPEEEDEVDSDVDAELEVDEPSDAELSAEDSVAEDEVDDSDAAGDFEPEEGDDADEGTVDSDVEADKKSATKKKKVVNTMADKKMSMSDHVRAEIDKRQSAGDSLRGVDIVNALAKRGIKVSPAQVSQLLKKAGVGQKARGPRKSKAAAEERSRAASSIRKGGEQKRAAPKTRLAERASGSLPVAHLKAAKAFLAACGDSYDEATNVLQLHKQLHDVL